jgi:hypothetical protein
MTAVDVALRDRDRDARIDRRRVGGEGSEEVGLKMSFEGILIFVLLLFDLMLGLFF